MQPSLLKMNSVWTSSIRQILVGVFQRIISSVVTPVMIVLKQMIVYLVVFYLIVTIVNIVLAQPISVIKNISGLMNSFLKRNGKGVAKLSIFLLIVFIKAINNGFLLL